MPFIKVRAERHLSSLAAGMRLTAAAVALSLGAACMSTSDLLTVQNPNAVGTGVFDDPSNATLMVNSVIGDFECAFGSYVMGEGLATDELHDATLNNGDWNLDRRDNGFTSGFYGVNPCTTITGVYTPLSTARAEADKAIARLTGWTTAQVPNRVTLLAQANLYAGFSYATLGMAMCQAAFDLGPLVDQKGMFTLAETRFSDAFTAAQSAGLTNLQNAALLGRARVRLFLHNNAGAITDAQAIPAGFVFNAAMDATNPRRFNPAFTSISTNGTSTVETTARALTTENNEVDPRSAMIKLNTRSADGVNTIYIPAKYNAATLTAGEAIPLPIARYAEAQLILAEAQGGAAGVTIINNMRAAVGLSPYTGASDAASMKVLIASERQRVLFLEGFRAFDIERFSLPLVPAAGAPYLAGGVYGGTVCLPLPDLERFANPNIKAADLIDGVQGHFSPP
jgi:hypothetical protein